MLRLAEGVEYPGQVMPITSYPIETVADRFHVSVRFLKREIANAKLLAFGSRGDKRISGTSLEHWAINRQFEINREQKRLACNDIADTQLDLELEFL